MGRFLTPCQFFQDHLKDQTIFFIAVDRHLTRNIFVPTHSQLDKLKVSAEFCKLRAALDVVVIIFRVNL